MPNIGIGNIYEISEQLENYDKITLNWSDIRKIKFLGTVLNEELYNFFIVHENSFLNFRQAKEGIIKYVSLLTGQTAPQANFIQDYCNEIDPCWDNFKRNTIIAQPFKIKIDFAITRNVLLPKLQKAFISNEKDFSFDYESCHKKYIEEKLGHFDYCFNKWSTLLCSNDNLRYGKESEEKSNEGIYQYFEPKSGSIAYAKEKMCYFNIAVLHFTNTIVHESFVLPRASPIIFVNSAAIHRAELIEEPLLKVIHSNFKVGLNTQPKCRHKITRQKFNKSGNKIESRVFGSSYSVARYALLGKNFSLIDFFTKIILKGKRNLMANHHIYPWLAR